MKGKNFIGTITILFFTITSFGQKRLSKGEHFAEINGIKIHYYVGGEGPVCLFPSSGWGASVEGYMKSLKQFEKYFTMVWYDTRITGKSTGPNDSTKYGSKEFMEDMEELRIYLKQKKVWIAGHSMGGFQVLNYGIHYNNNLNGIIAIGACAVRDNLRYSEIHRLILKRKDQPYFQKGYDVIYPQDSKIISYRDAMHFVLPFYFHDTINIKKFKAYEAGAFSDKAAKYSQVSNLGVENLLPDLYKISVPTLIIVGDDDFICDKISQADRISKEITNSTEIVIKDAGHYCWIEQPKQFFFDTKKWFIKQGLKAHN